MKGAVRHSDGKVGPRTNFVAPATKFVRGPTLPWACYDRFSAILHTSSARRVAVLLEAEQIQSRQNAEGIEHDQANEPRELIVPRTFPHANAFQHGIADRNHDDDWKEHSEPSREMMMNFHITRLPRARNESRNLRTAGLRPAAM